MKTETPLDIFEGTKNLKRLRGSAALWFQSYKTTQSARTEVLLSQPDRGKLLSLMIHKFIRVCA